MPALRICKSNSRNPIDEFFIVTALLAQTLKSKGVPLESDPYLIYDEFKEADPGRQRDFLDKCRFYIRASEKAIEQEIELLHDKQFIWNTVKDMGLVLPSDVFELITDHDEVEIYDSRGIQVFANFEFFRKVSYTPEEMYWKSWAELFERDQKHFDQLMQNFVYSITEATGPFKPSIDKHLACEIGSRRMKKNLVEFKMFAPIRSKLTNEKYMIASSRMDLVSEQPV